MRDMLGLEIEVGDEVVYTSDRGYPTLTVGEVIGVTTDSAKIKRRTTGSHHGPRDGMRRKWVYDRKTGTGEYVMVPAIATRIGMPNRVLITKKAAR